MNWQDLSPECIGSSSRFEEEGGLHFGTVKGHKTPEKIPIWNWGGPYSSFKEADTAQIYYRWRFIQIHLLSQYQV
jgi:hypothetical protein